MPPKTERFEMRLDQGTADALDNWRASQSIPLSRAEAIRRLIEGGAIEPKRGVTFSDGEKLILLMLCELYKHLKVNGDFKPDFIEAAILEGQLWALEWELQGIFHGYEAKKSDVSAVVDVLDLWTFLEEAYESLPKKEKDRIKQSDVSFGSHGSFLGFDGNNESDERAIARFLVEKMNRFSRFKGREMNSHLPMMDEYRAMIRAFDPIRRNLHGRQGLNADEIITILQAARA